MKTAYALVFTVLFLPLLNSCKQDFDITADYKEVPVVYGLLNSKETVHYIRIQKGFLIEGSAYTAANVPDSIYYPDVLTVKLIPYLNGTQNGSPLNLQRTNFTNKDSGIFSYPSNVLYVCTANLDQNKTYKLEVTNTSNGNKFSAETALVKDYTIVTPYRGQKMALSSVNPPKIVYYSATNGGIYDVKIRFPYKEYDANSNAFLFDSAVEFYFYKSKSISDISGGQNIIDELNGTLILNELSHAAQLEKRTDRYRLFNDDEGMTFTFYAGGAELSNFVNSQIAQGSGLASNEALPPYTNVTNGYGLLSSRYYKSVDSVLLNVDGLDTLACSPIMAGIRFKGSFGQICE